MVHCIECGDKVHRDDCEETMSGHQICLGCVNKNDRPEVRIFKASYDDRYIGSISFKDDEFTTTGDDPEVIEEKLANIPLALLPVGWSVKVPVRIK